MYFSSSSCLNAMNSSISYYSGTLSYRLFLRLFLICIVSLFLYSIIDWKTFCFNSFSFSSFSFMIFPREHSYILKNHASYRIIDNFPLILRKIIKLIPVLLGHAFLPLGANKTGFILLIHLHSAERYSATCQGRF